jgi:hydrogenase/urease accessory protein HupE
MDMLSISIAIAAAHAGHAGDHGWLAGAAQPLLSWDHFAAAVFVVLVVAIGLVAVARAEPQRER